LWAAGGQCLLKRPKLRRPARSYMPLATGHVTCQPETRDNLSCCA
jgi:hypothetical protein